VLEAHHTHFVLTPGSEWGDESIWISRLATALASTQPSVSVLINGGEIAYQDLAHSVEQLRPVIVIEGSGARRMCWRQPCRENGKTSGPDRSSLQVC
jgi:hypothetical protein